MKGVVTRLLLGALGVEKGRRIPYPVLADMSLKGAEQVRRSREQARFHHGRHDRHVIAGLDLAVLRRANRVSDFQADVPEKHEEPADGFVDHGIAGPVPQHHEVDVGVGMQFAAPVPTDSYQRAAVVQLGREMFPGGQHDLVDDAGTKPHQRFHRFIGAETLIERLVRTGKHLAERLDRAVRSGERMIEQRPVDHSGPLRSASGGGRAHGPAAPRVSTS